jgi:Fur family transcriptional regulator, peroxide stress response regulator
LSLELAKNLLVKAGLKVTHQRLVLYEAVRHMQHHPTVEQIYEVVRPEHPTLSLATVYKNLEAFFHHGLIGKVFSPEGHMRYDPRTENHGHIYCANTKEIIDFYDEELNQLITDFFRKKKVNNLRIKNISLQINGERLDPEKEVIIK